MSSSESKEKRKMMKAVNDRFKSIELTYNLFRNNPYDLDYIHRLRVEMRKIRALLNFLKPIIDKEIYQTLNATFRSLGQLLSEIRDLDALIEGINIIAIENPELMNNYASIFGYLEDERLKEAHLIADKEVIHKFDRGLQKSKKLLNELEFHLEYTNEKSFEDFIIGNYKNKGKKLNKKYKKIESNDYQAIHTLRKEAKKVRYAAVGFKAILPKKLRKPIKNKAKKIQERLGEITDTHVSIQKLEEYKDKVTSINIKGSFQKLIDYKSI